MSDPETIQNVKQANEEFERKYCKATGEEHPDGHKLMHDILAKRLQTVGGKQYYDSANYTMEKNDPAKNLKIPVISHELAYTVGEKSPPNPRLSPKGRRLSSSSGSSLADSTGCDSGLSGSQNLTQCQNPTITSQNSHPMSQNSPFISTLPSTNSPSSNLCHNSLIQNHYILKSHSKDSAGPPHIISSGVSSGIASGPSSVHGGSSPGGHHSPLNFHGWHHSSHAFGAYNSNSHNHSGHGSSFHGSQSSSSSHYSGSPLNMSHHLGPHGHMSPLHVNTEFSKPVRRLSSTSSCGEPSPLANEGMIQVAFKRPPIPGLDCEAYHGDAIQVSLHSPHSPCTKSTRGRSPSSTHFCLSDSNSCRNSPINTDFGVSIEEECGAGDNNTTSIDRENNDIIANKKINPASSHAGSQPMEIKVPIQCKRIKGSCDVDECSESLNRTNTLTKDQEDKCDDNENCEGDCMD